MLKLNSGISIQILNDNDRYACERLDDYIQSFKLFSELVKNCKRNKGNFKWILIIINYISSIIFIKILIAFDYTFFKQALFRSVLHVLTWFFGRKHRSYMLFSPMRGPQSHGLC